MLRAFILKKKKAILYHLGGWLVFIVYEMSFLFLMERIKTGAGIFGDYVIPYAINIGLFYFHAAVTLDLSYSGNKRRHSVFVILLLSEMAVYLMLMRLTSWLFSGNEIPFTKYLFDTSGNAIIPSIWRSLYFILFSTSMWFIYRYLENQKKLQEVQTNILRQQKENQEVQLQLITVQNAFLQAQINPHLLFNTLNFIYNKVRVTSPDAANAIIALTDMMRYSLNNSNPGGKVLLTHEVEQIENLLKINEFRFDKGLHLLLVADKSTFNNIRILPLTLLPFVENVFKYAELINPSFPAEISIVVKDDTIFFKTYNKKRMPVNFHSQKIGINNVRNRLKSHYSDDFTLEIIDELNTFTVLLTIRSLI